MAQRQTSWFRILILALSGGAIYLLPYLRFGFWDTMISELHLTNTQLGTIGAYYGISAIPSYFLGGVLADKLKAKKLLAFSLISTGLLGFYFGILPGYKALLFIHACWGITTTLTFWAAFQKLTRLSAPPEKQAKIFGIITASRSFLYVILSSLALWLASFFVSQATGLSAAIFFISAMHIIFGSAVLIFWNEEKESEAQSKENIFSFNDLKAVLRIPEVWILSITMFAVYYMSRIAEVITPYCSSPVALAVPVVLAGIIGNAKEYGVAPFAGFLAAAFADRMGRIRFSIISIVVAMTSVAILLVIPTSATILSVVLLLTYTLFCWCAYMLVFAILDDADVPDEYSGIAIGTVSAIGFISESAGSYTVGRVLDAFEGLAGFHMIFKIMIGSGLVTIVCYIVCAYFIKAKKSKKADVAQAITDCSAEPA